VIFQTFRFATALERERRTLLYRIARWFLRPRRRKVGA